MTIEQYRAITVEGDRTQLVDGAVVVNEPKLIHGVLQFRLATALGAWIEAGEGRGLASMPTDVVLDEHNVYGPDIVWFAERHRPVDLDRYPTRVPDLCVEIRSPGTWRYDIGAKKSAYERAGLPELWLVDDVACCVLVFRRSDPSAGSFDVALELTTRDELTSPQLPGFGLAVQKLFR
jgi:Uma2 family endonuclease